MKNYHCLIIFMILSFLKVSAQISDIPKEYILLAKLTLLSEGLNNNDVKVTQENIVKFLDRDVDISKIRQSSFKDFIFFSIKPVKTQLLDKELPIIYFNEVCKEYIIAIQTSSRYVYKLKGFQLNDFANFFKFLVNNNYQYINNGKEFVKSYIVEGLDFECLYDSMGRKNTKGSKQYECLCNTCMKIVEIH